MKLSYNTPSSLHLKLGIALLLSSASALTAATSSFTNTLPTTDILLENTSLSSSANLQLRNIGSTATDNSRWVGVGFTAPATTSTLDKATLYVAFDSESGDGYVNATALGATLQIDIVTLSSLTASPATPYSVTYSETTTLPASYSNDTYLTFDLATPVTLSANQNYGIVLSFVSNATNRGINFRQAPGGTAGTNSIGNTFFSGDQGDTWSTNSPIAFVLQTAVPEPATYPVFSGLVVMGVVACRRRLRNIA